MPAVAYFVRDYQRLQAIYTWPQFALFAYVLYVPSRHCEPVCPCQLLYSDVFSYHAMHCLRAPKS